jgi:hypothetical protein
MLSSEEVCGKFRHILFVVPFQVGWKPFCFIVVSFQCGWNPFDLFVVSFRVVGSHFVFDTNVEDVGYSLLRDLGMLIRSTLECNFIPIS